MKKKSRDGRERFVRDWNKYLFEVSRRKKVRNHSSNPTRLSFENESTPITNPTVTYIEKISKLKGVDGRFVDGNKIKIPKTFNFYDDPEGALLFIHSATKLVCRGKQRSITLDYSGAKKYCLGAECLLGVSLIEARKNNPNFSETNIQLNGIYPKKEQYLEIIRDIGLVKEMDEATPGKIKDLSIKVNNPKQRIFKSESIGKEDASAFARDKKNLTAENFTGYINDCLGDHELELNETAADHLTSCMGEMLDNAERHCGTPQRSRWYVRGYVNNKLRNPVCELTIFNFGNTIFESFEGLPPDHYSLNEHVKKYVNKHIGKRGMFSEGLTTVAALQGRCSCMNEHDFDSSGTGTIELLKFFQDMHDNLERIRGVNEEKPRMSLISGSTHISFDGTYKLQRRLTMDGESEFYTYPFNDQTLEKEPDRAYLKEMKKARFPGVMINIRFPLQKTQRT
ncbi:hypothetical protein [Rahnella sp. WP5]|uniref:hypothetical protein n=1 Tax=Rahnella sp. WP5 TaxID=1500266 RepID=UPI0005615FB7|nr:hypothetical protein [Rahnella sp. WP5]